MFKPQFAPLVAAGTKTQTVRPTPKRMPKIGEPISLRKWRGLPYRSKQVVLRDATVTQISPVTMRVGAAGQLLISVGGGTVDQEAFAHADGFPSAELMRDWFAEQHGLPFTGILIRWN